MAEPRTHNQDTAETPSCPPMPGNPDRPPPPTLQGLSTPIPASKAPGTLRRTLMMPEPIVGHFPAVPGEM